MCYAFYWSLSSCVSCKKENNPKLALGISVPVYIPFSDSYSSVSWKRKYWGKLKNMSMQKARQQKVVRLCGEIMNCSISVVSLLIKFLISENLKTTKIKLKSKCWQQGCYSMDFFSYCGQKKVPYCRSLVVYRSRSWLDQSEAVFLNEHEWQLWAQINWAVE